MGHSEPFKASEVPDDKLQLLVHKSNTGIEDSYFDASWTTALDKAPFISATIGSFKRMSSIHGELSWPNDWKDLYALMHGHDEDFFVPDFDTLVSMAVVFSHEDLSEPIRRWGLLKASYEEDLSAMADAPSLPGSETTILTPYAQFHHTQGQPGQLSNVLVHSSFRISYELATFYYRTTNAKIMPSKSGLLSEVGKDISFLPVFKQTL